MPSQHLPQLSPGKRQHPMDHGSSYPGRDSSRSLRNLHSPPETRDPPPQVEDQQMHPNPQTRQGGERPSQELPAHLTRQLPQQNPGKGGRAKDSQGGHRSRTINNKQTGSQERRPVHDALFRLPTPAQEWLLTPKSNEKALPMRPTLLAMAIDGAFNTVRHDWLIDTMCMSVFTTYLTT